MLQLAEGLRRRRGDRKSSAVKTGSGHPTDTDSVDDVTEQRDDRPTSGRQDRSRLAIRDFRLVLVLSLSRHRMVTLIVAQLVRSRSTGFESRDRKAVYYSDALPLRFLRFSKPE